MRALVVGYGSAGKRHMRNLSALGIEAEAVDPFVPESRYQTVDQAMDDARWDIVVIATPPDLHLEQIVQVADSGTRVLCEKPLCDLGQESMAKDVVHDYKNRVTVAYNYRFHQAFSNPRLVHHRKGYGLTSSQYRKTWPSWGFLLDHLAHAVDMVQWEAGKELVVKNAFHDDTLDDSYWHVQATVGNEPCILTDEVYHVPARRLVYLKTPDKTYVLNKDMGMFDRMWQRFLSNDVPYPGLEEAYQVQLRLAEIYELAGER